MTISLKDKQNSKVNTPESTIEMYTNWNQDDKWGFWYLIGRFVGWYRLYSTNLVCLANERFWYSYGWNLYL